MTAQEFKEKEFQTDPLPVAGNAGMKTPNRGILEG